MSDAAHRFEDTASEPQAKRPRTGGSRSRFFVFTLNGYTSEQLSHLRDEVPGECEYMCFQPELGSSGNKHLQGVICFQHPRMLTGVRRVFSPCKPHIEAMAGSVEQAVAYCSKEETRDSDAGFSFTEWGERPRKGAGAGKGSRSDLSEVCASALRGSTLNDIAKSHPEQFIKFHSGITALVSATVKPRRSQTELVWYYGPTGSGKSRTAYSENPDAYAKNPGNKWWCGYSQESVVILDDYRADFCKFSELLRYADWNPLLVEYKGGTTHFNSKKIIITCPDHPTVVWASRGAEKLNQLLRRITEIRWFGDGPEPEIDGQYAACFVR